MMAPSMWWSYGFFAGARAGVMCAAFACATWAHAQTPIHGPWPTREALAAERALITQRFDAEEAACRQQFAVTGCVADVRASRRDALAPVRERELQLEDQERQARVAQRALDLAAKRQAQRAVPAATPSIERRVRQLPDESSAAAPGLVEGASARPGQGAAAAHAAERARAAAKRREAALATQTEIAKKLAELAARGKPVVGLPVPAVPPLTAASAASAAGR
jgi:colicin import membrane protein